MFKRAPDLDAIRDELSRVRAERDALHEQLAAERALSETLSDDVVQHVSAPSQAPPGAVPGPPASPTGLVPFLDAASDELARVRRSGEQVALLLIDIDGFRELNATHGRAAGDAALATIDRLLGTVARPGDMRARTGSDEFAVLLANCPVEAAHGHAETFIRLLEDLVPNDAGAFTVSVGVAPHRRGQTIERLMADAADGLDRARARGGARAEVSVDGGEAERAARADVDLDVAEALAAALIERDRFTGEQSRSLVQMTRSVARVLGLDSAETDRVAAAALLHDIGKLAIPDRILHKPEQLDEQEWDLVRELPLIGERILRAIPGLGDIARIVRHVHERFDGSGYPDKLRGTEIPIGSRIILAADTYHAMTSETPYRAAMTHAEAIRELAACAGSQFDPRVTESLISDLHQQVQTGRLAPGQVAHS